MHELEQLLKDVIKFSDACSILEENGIPEPCYGDLLYKLGFVIIWKGIDDNTATRFRSTTAQQHQQRICDLVISKKP